MSPIETVNTYKVGKANAHIVGATPTEQKKIINNTGGKLYWKVSSDVSTSSTEIAVGSSYTTEVTIFLISETASYVTEETLVGTVAQDATFGDDVTIADTLKVTGVTTATGGIASATAVPGFYAGQWHPVAATSGTDTTPAEKKLFVTSIFIPCNKKIKGIGFLVGSVGGTNKVVAGIWSAAGKLLGHTSETTEGTLAGTAAEIQQIDLTAEYSAVGPAVYFIGLTMNGNTARLRSIPKNTAGANVFSEEITITAKNTLADITAPTAFTADKGPVSWVY